MKKTMLRGALLGLMLMLVALCASGCLFRPVENLYALPILPEEYADLQATILTTMNDMGAEYATISYGDNTSTVQLLDLDSDGEQETAAVFLRATAAEEKPMRVCLFRRDGDGDYQNVHTLQGDGSSIHSVVYEDLDGDGVKELIVSWQMSAKVYILSAYQLTSEGAEELVSTTYNEMYLTANLDGQGGKELLVFQQSSSGEGSNQAEYYRYQDGTMTMASGALLSDNLVDVQSAQLSRLSDGSRAVYVTSSTETGVLTDILVLTDVGLRNVTRSPATGTSAATTRTYTDVAVADINGDGILEVPMPMPAAALDMEGTSGYYMIYWCQFDSQGSIAVSCATYHSTSDGWYLMLPNGWLGNITVARNDTLSNRGERSVVFYRLPEEEGGKPVAFLTIYRLTGSNRITRANLPGRFIIRSDSSNVYAGLFHDVDWDCGIVQEELIQRFSMITAEWSAQ